MNHAIAWFIFALHEHTQTCSIKLFVIILFRADDCFVWSLQTTHKNTDTSLTLSHITSIAKELKT